MPVFCLFTLGRHGNFTAEVTIEQPDLLCTALALNIELLSILVCAVLQTSYYYYILNMSVPSEAYPRNASSVLSCISLHRVYILAHPSRAIWSQSFGSYGHVNREIDSEKWCTRYSAMYFFGGVWLNGFLCHLLFLRFTLTQRTEILQKGQYKLKITNDIMGTGNSEADIQCNGDKNKQIQHSNSRQINK